MITIKQLLDSVGYMQFKPRWVAKDKNGDITLFAHKPILEKNYDRWAQSDWGSKMFGPILLSEFYDKDWTKCIYEIKTLDQKDEK